ncbi:DUF4238 domain-containing protein [Mucilaginibacter panaciglaebae]
MTQKQISKRHHYLPRFLLKGFAMDDDRLHVYDKTTGMFWKEPASPKQIFWREDQNTFQIGDVKTDFLEGIYSRIDDETAPFHALLVKKPGPISLTLEEVVQLLRFVTISYYRVPLNDQFIKDYVSSHSPQKLGFKIINKDSPDEAVPADIYEKIMGEPAFVESYRISKALLELLAYAENLVVDDWSVAAPTALNGIGLIGDNPVILKQGFAGYIVLHELIMPISKHHIIYHVKGKKPVQLSPEHKLKVDLCQILQAQQYVCGSNREYMQTLINYLAIPENNLTIERVTNDLFNDFK